MKTVGTISRGIKAPVIKQGDNLVEIICDSIANAVLEQNITLCDHDIVAITEAVVARCQGNYATIDQIASDVRRLTGGGVVGLIFPILSRNRFSLILSAIAKGVDKLIIQLSYPSDEVGNPLISYELLDMKNVNPYSDSFSQQEFENIFGKVTHPFTDVNYIELYRTLGGENCQVVFSNKSDYILQFTDTVINADIHTRKRTKQQLLNKGAKKVISLDEILTQPSNGSGYNEKYGLLGSNLATTNSVKLFPNNTQQFVDEMANALNKKFNKQIEVMIYGDGAFKDPVGGIWELADPEVCPAHTAGLSGNPNEIKLKYLADNNLSNLSGKELEEQMKKLIRQKETVSKSDSMLSQGTTPRRLTDLIGSLCDLTSGSGDKGTPIVLIQNYFDNYGTE